MRRGNNQKERFYIISLGEKLQVLTNIGSPSYLEICGEHKISQGQATTICKEAERLKALEVSGGCLSSRKNLKVR